MKKREGSRVYCIEYHELGDKENKKPESKESKNYFYIPVVELNDNNGTVTFLGGSDALQRELARG
jgi:hypothetical protein